MLLDQIGNAKDIHRLSAREYKELASDIRRFMIQSVSRTGGHLASNLGAVELTIALHAAFDLPNDKIIWDVGHQAYTHKILSGRKDAMATLRQFGGLSGFPKHKESPYDVVDTGHSTTSISAGLGLAQARELLGEHYKVVSVIGDGSMTGGMAFEALNNAAHLKSNFIIVLNDNEMSISKNVGGLSRYLTGIRTSEAYHGLKDGVTTAINRIPVVGDDLYQTISRTKSSIKQIMIPGMLFEDLGITYLGPFPGHDVPTMVRAFKEAARIRGPVVVHVKTVKGKGYAPAEKDPSRFHGIGAFDVQTGKSLGSSSTTYTDVFSDAVCELAQDHQDLVAMTAAMPGGTGLDAFAKHFPSRFFDTGIAEQHMVTSAAGMAIGGLRPVVCVYSSFLQRAYDQVLHDVALMDLPVIFCVDRAGVVGNDGETHQGMFDLAFLSSIPGMYVIVPAGMEELRKALNFAYELKKPVAIRYPRGKAWIEPYDTADYELGKSETLRGGSDLAILAVGSFVQTALETAEILAKKGIEARVVNMRFVKPIDSVLLEELRETVPLVVTMEDASCLGGLGEKAAEYYAPFEKRPMLEMAAYPDEFIPQGTQKELRLAYGMTAEQLAERIERKLKQ